MFIIAPHPISKNSAHYKRVYAYMLEHGTPAIRAVYSEEYECWLAVEGSHRLAAAESLGITPEIIAVQWSDTIEHDLQDFCSPCKVEDLRRYLEDRRNVGNGSVRYEFGE
jgi:hypothetical protein